MSTTKKKPAAKKSNGNAEAKVVSEPLHVRVCGFGPRDFEGSIEDGFNFIEGENGAGKSQVLVALLWALGDKNMKPRLRHGAAEGYVEINGQRLATLDKEMAGAKDNERALYYQSLITEVIVPNVKDPKCAEPRRIACLMELVEVKLTDDALLTLAGEDQEVLDYALNREPAIRLKSVTDAAERMAHWAHYLKREVYGVAADVAQGRITGATVEKPEVLSEISSDEAKGNYDRAVRDHDRKSGEWEQRQARESQIAQLKAVQFERPDVAQAEEDRKASFHDFEVAIRQVSRLEAELAAALESQRLASQNNAQAENRLKTAKEADAQWLRNEELLNSTISGADAEAVETARLAAQRAYEQLEQAKATEAYEEACVVVETAQNEMNQALKNFKRVEKVAQGVTRQLAQLFNDAGIKGLTVEDGKLMKVHEDKTLEPVVDLSAGQRAKLLLPLLTRHKFPYSIIVLPESFVGSLQPSALKTVEEEFAAGGWRVLVERPTDEAGLRVERGLSAEKAGEAAHV